jgi:multidrug resistance efflux pump
MDAKEALFHLKESCYCAACAEALTALRSVVDERDALKAEVERLQVQLAGCSTAALGWNEKSAKQGDYGWSAPYQDVLDLRQRCEKAEAELERVRELSRDLAWERDNK